MRAIGFSNEGRVAAGFSNRRMVFWKSDSHPHRDSYLQQLAFGHRFAIVGATVDANISCINFGSPSGARLSAQ
jgi:hypothetical protein